MADGARARTRARLLRGLAIYLATLVLIACLVGILSGNVAAAVITFIALLLVMPILATCLRIAYQKRHGLPVRGYWTRG